MPIKTNYVAVCDQCQDEEHCRAGERIGEFCDRLKADGWLLPWSGDVWCSTDCRDFKGSETSEAK